MRIVRTIAELREEVAAARARGASIGLVPTMGALHEGHLSLVRATSRSRQSGALRTEALGRNASAFLARGGEATASYAAEATLGFSRRAEHGELPDMIPPFVVMSIFVNPTQFTESADLAAYPRDEARDAALAAAAGVDVLFAPDAAEMYPAGFATTVHISGAITETLEGAKRGAAHFDGVATIVAKLLLAASPDAAYFGQKDAQQVVVVRRLVADLGIPTRIVACPISRDADGLARSSRNVRLSAEERQKALVIPRALTAVEAAVASGETRVTQLAERARAELAGVGIDPEYLAFVDPDTLEEVTTIKQSTLCAVAARVGSVRLLDNVLLGPGDDGRNGD